MADIKEKDNDGSKEAGSPKAPNKKDKKKYHAFRSDGDDSSDQDEIDSPVAKTQKVKKDRNSFKVKIKSMKGKKKDKEKKKKVKKTADDIEDGTVSREVIFGVPLELAVERSAFPDKIPLPRIVRDCIQHIEETGLETEGLYRVSGIKSKVDQMKQLYDEGKPVSFIDVDPCATSSLLKLYLRELPSSVLTTRLAPIFDSCVGLTDVNEQVRRFQQLINDLPCPNRTLLAWLFTHFSHVMQKHSANKMSIQNLTIVFSPTMSISHGVLNIFFEHTPEFFPDTELVRYVPPLKKEDNDDYPEDVADLQDLLKENEMVLTDLHDRVNQGCQDKEVMEELWERQRKSTQIKRKIKAKVQREKQNRESLIHEEECNISNLHDKTDTEAKEIQKNVEKSPLNQNLLSSKVNTNIKNNIKSNSDINLSEIKSEIVMYSNLHSTSTPINIPSQKIRKSPNKSSSQLQLHSNPDAISNSINIQSKNIESSPNKSSSQQQLHSNPDSISNSINVQFKNIERSPNKSSSQQLLHSSLNSLSNSINIQSNVLEKSPFKNSSQFGCVKNESEKPKDTTNLKNPLQEQIDAEIKKLQLEEKQLMFENEELLKIEESLHKKIQQEKLEVENLKARIFEFENCKTSTSSSSSSSTNSLFNDTERIYNEVDNMELEQNLKDLECRNKELELENNDIILKIIEECNLCAKIMAKIRLLETEQ
ncbi:ralA-binding protein 1 isoform X4 [Hydra vulgaris]|uniref:RalA-binding protein 1 isoform X4 n=1 Tax=Hydra vulgaris TaxID=6087 RepID=A0ABM4BR43_HYDVU